MNIVSYIDAISWERLGVNVYNHLYITTRQPNDGYTVDDLKDTTLEYQLAHSFYKSGAKSRKIERPNLLKTLTFRQSS